MNKQKETPSRFPPLSLGLSLPPQSSFSPSSSIYSLSHDLPNDLPRKIDVDSNPPRQRDHDKRPLMDRHSVGEEGRQCQIYDFHDVQRVRSLPFTADQNLYRALVLFRYGIQILREMEVAD